MASIEFSSDILGIIEISNWRPTQEQEQSSDIEQQPPFGDRKYSNSLPQKRRGDT